MSVKSLLPLPFESSFSQFVYSVIQVLSASLFIAFSAQIVIPLYFTPVPLSGLTFAVMLVGACLGSRKGMLAASAYLLEGAMGLPVFGSAHFGLGPLLGSNGGYLIALPLQAYLVGWCIERQQVVSSLKSFWALLLSSGMVLGLGSLWLSHFVGFENAILMGAVPFVVGDVLKCFAIVSYLKARN